MCVRPGDHSGIIEHEERVTDTAVSVTRFLRSVSALPKSSESTCLCRYQFSYMRNLIGANWPYLVRRQCDHRNCVATEGHEFDGVPPPSQVHHDHRADVACLQPALRHISR